MFDELLVLVVCKSETLDWRVPMADPLFATVVCKLPMFISFVVVRLPRLVKLFPTLVELIKIVGAEIWFVLVNTPIVALVKFAEESVRLALLPVTLSVVVDKDGMVADAAVRLAQEIPCPTLRLPETTWFPADIEWLIIRLLWLISEFSNGVKRNCRNYSGAVDSTDPS
jgi:hypothetical protein